MGAPYGRGCEAVSVIIAAHLENIREAEVGTISLQNFAIDTFSGERHDQPAPSCLGVLPKEPPPDLLSAG